MKNLSTLLLALGLLFPLALNAQKIERCGTPGEISEHLIAYRAERGQVQSRFQGDTLFIKMKVHLVGTDQGEGYYGLNGLLESVCKLNEDMIQSGIMLELDNDINYIASDRYNEHSFAAGRQMMVRNNVDGYVNCYIVSDPAGNCGYFSPSGDAVALRKNCLGPDNTTWAHELGHFFSLPHTFVGWEGTDYEYNTRAPRFINGVEVELASGSNCATAADGFCDTEADYLSFRWTCRGFYSPDSLMDPDSVKFLVDGRNIMSYSNDICARYFSDEQTDAMIWNINNRRSSLISQNEIPKAITFDMAEFEPTAGFGGEVVQYDDALISWNPVENATSYLIEIARKRPFPTPPEYTFIVTDTFAEIDFFELGNLYEWRVKPFNSAYTCADYSENILLEAQETVSSQNIIDSDLFELYPNPIQNSEVITVSYKTPNSGLGELFISNLNGQELFRTTKRVQSGTNLWAIPTQNFTSGVYILRYQDEQGLISKKILIQ